MSRPTADRRAVRASAALTAALLLLTACHSGSGAGPAASSAGSSSASSSGADGQSSAASSDAGSSSAQATPTSSAGEESSAGPPTSSAGAPAPVGGDTEWDGAWGGAAQEPQTHSANDTVPLTFKVQDGKVTDFVVDLPFVCGSGGSGAAYMTDGAIVSGKVDKTTVLGGSHESTTRVVGYFAGTTAYGTVYYVMPGVCDSTQWTWKATRTAGPGALSSAAAPQSSDQVAESSAGLPESSADHGSSAADDGGATISGSAWSATVPPGWSIAPTQSGDDADLASADGERAISVSAGQQTGSADTVDSLATAAVTQLESDGYTMIQQPLTHTWAGRPDFVLTAGDAGSGTDVEVVGVIVGAQEIVVTYAVHGSITADDVAASTLQELESSWHWKG